MSDQPLQNLIYSVNQISITNLHHGDEQEAADIVAIHLTKFWARGMRQQIIEYAKTDGSELTAVASQAIERLAQLQEA